jgi:hypothetical protein
MSQADLRTTLRTIAILIAVAAAIDPAFARIVAASRPLIAVRAAHAEIDAALQGVRDAFPDRSVIVREVKNGRLPCANDEDCVLVADGTIDVDWDQRLRPMSLIKMPIVGEPNVRMLSVAVSRGHRAAAGMARVRLEGRGVTGRTSELRVLDGLAVVGAATHEWSKDVTVVVDVPWWPIAEGTRPLRIEVSPIEKEITAIDNRIDVGVPIATDRIPVLVFDARPSWQSTFVRRALEDDARFAVEHRVRVAPSLSAGTPNGRLDAATLDRVPLLVAGGLDALTASDVSLLERYVRQRGGTLVALPEGRPSGPAARLFGDGWVEQLSVTPQSIGPLRASELLRAGTVSPAATVLASSGDAPVIVSSPTGAGRIVIVGAIDAWRYRQSDDGDRFWRSLAAEGAAAGEGLSVTFRDDLVERGARTTIALIDRRMEPVASSDASVVQRCGDALAQPVRVWPGGSIGEFAGEIAATAGSICSIEARVGDRQATASIAVVDRASRGIDATLAKLERRVRASRGEILDLGQEARIAPTFADSLTLSRDVTAYPMRSAWWIMPFAACLSIEWFLRRRAGLR